MPALPAPRPVDWVGALLQHLGLLALAGAVGTLAWQAVLWVMEGAWPPFPLANIWTFFGFTMPWLRWAGAEQTLLWLADKPLSAVLGGLGVGFVVLGRGLSGG